MIPCRTEVLSFVTASRREGPHEQRVFLQRYDAAMEEAGRSQAVAAGDTVAGRSATPAALVSRAAGGAGQPREAGETGETEELRTPTCTSAAVGHWVMGSWGRSESRNTEGVAEQERADEQQAIACHARPEAEQQCLLA